ncbi:MAG: ASKHA domain-containing protein, partial [Smithellaceae bacterium]|nr:ASKHA domain-containing protein [Smithellaceae bacterium]
FFIDLGTNGELFVINRRGEIFATSCAMGPALEGMNISCGMTAGEGAITHFQLEKTSLRRQTMGGGPSRGIAGTALIDLVAVLLERKIISANGALASAVGADALPPPLVLTDEGKEKRVDIERNIYLSQKDIRQLQLAKGASLAAGRMLLSQADCSIQDIENVVIAGALGRHLDLENFRRLSFLPTFPQAVFHLLGDTSLEAAARACRDEAFLKEARRLRETVREVRLAEEPAFQKEFISALDF